MPGFRQITDIPETVISGCHPIASAAVSVALLPSVSRALPVSRRGLFVDYLLVPLLLAVVASVPLMAGGDRWLADIIYRQEGGHWALKNVWWTTRLIHHGGKNLSTLAGVLVLLALLRACFHERWKPLRKPLLYLLLAVGLSTGITVLVKKLTNMDCPWDLQRYGGLHPFISLFQPRPRALGHNACFPAGHASAGYGWIALYFFAWQVRPRWRWPALATALLAGLTFGISQQLRGAHFLSHDLWTLTISWTVAVLLYMAMFPPAPTAPDRA